MIGILRFLAAVTALAGCLMVLYGGYYFGQLDRSAKPSPTCMCDHHCPRTA